MAVQWGSWQYSGGNGMRVGIDVSTSRVTSSSTTVKFTYRVYTQNQYRYNDNQTLSFGGQNGSGSVPFNNTSTGGSVLRATRTYTYTYPAGSYNTSPGSRSFSATLSGAYNGVTPSRSVSTAIPARPGGPPEAVTDITATYVNDNNITVTWTNNPTIEKPYTSLNVIRETYTGATWDAGVTAATLGGSTTSFSDTGTVTNRGYRYRIRPANNAGTGPTTNVSGTVYTTPLHPSAATAGFNDNGQIVVSWTPANYTSSTIRFDISRKVGTGSWTSVATGINATSWIDTSPPGGEVTYQISARDTSNSRTSLQPRETNSVVTAIPPLAPTNLTPNGVAVDPADDIVLSYQHNHGGDYAPQSAVQARYSTDNGATWVTGVLTPTPDQEFIIPGGFLTSGLTYQWQVRTQGVVAEGPGPWSALATFSTSTKPVVSITSPDGPVGTLPILAEWDYAQDDGEPQTAWTALLIDEMGNLLQMRTGTDTAAATVFDYPFENGAQFTIRVLVRSASGLWSEAAEITEVVDFLPPATPLLDATYDPCTGAMVLDLSANEPEEGVSDVVDYVDLQRRLDGKGDWHTLVTGLYVNNQLPILYEETFDAGDGGWRSFNHFSSWHPAAARVSNNAPIPPGYIDGPDYLEVTWVTPDPGADGQNMLYNLTGMEVGQQYTVLMQVYNPTSTQLRAEVYFNGAVFDVPPSPDWQLVRMTFVASATSRDFGLFSRNPVEGEKVYIDKVRVYVGETEDYPENTIVPTTVVDPIPQTAGLNEYRAIAYAPSGAISISEVEVEEGTNRSGKHLWVFLAYGPTFSQVLRFRGDPQITASASRAREPLSLLRPGLPVGLLGPQTGRVLGVSGRLRYDETCRSDDPCRYDSHRDEWEQASWDSTIVCYRDWTGRRIFGILGQTVETSDDFPGMGSVSFEVIETAYTERTGALPGQPGE